MGTLLVMLLAVGAAGGLTYLAMLIVYLIKKAKGIHMQMGDTVLYTMEFDADTSYSPNIGPAVVTKVVTADATVLDIYVLFQNGSFTKLNCAQGQPGQRGTWHPKA